LRITLLTSILKKDLENDYIIKNYPMIENGFIVNIKNSTTAIQEIKLFSENLPAGVSVNTINDKYHFEALKLAAQENLFNGNSLTTNSDEAVQIEIVNDGKVENILLNGRYEGPTIIIDGRTNYVKVVCSAKGEFYIRLLTLPFEMI